MCCHIFAIINCDRLYFDRLKGKRYRWSDYLWRGRFADCIQSFINIGVATMVLPNTGLSLPFVSYGLTSLVCFFMGIGFVLNVGLQPNKYQ